MSEYIDREKFISDIKIRYCKPCENEGKDYKHTKCRACWVDDMIDEIEGAPTAEVIKVKHGKWILEVRSFYADNWDESIELVVYILASCSNCSEEHHPKQVFSKRLYAPEDADDDFRFDQEYEKSKALEEFKQKGYKFQNYCPNCGAKMDLEGQQ